MENYTRCSEREEIFEYGLATNCKCDYCDGKLVQIGTGKDEFDVLPLYSCTSCRYYETIVNDNNHAVIKKIDKFY